MSRPVRECYAPVLRYRRQQGGTMSGWLDTDRGRDEWEQEEARREEIAMLEREADKREKSYRLRNDALVSDEQ